MRGDEFLGVGATGPVVEGLLAASVASGRGGSLAGGDGFGSLLNRPAKKRKKIPVLILDPEEAMAAANEIQRIAAEDFANADPAARDEVRVVFAALDWAGESAAVDPAEDLADAEDFAEPDYAADPGVEALEPLAEPFDVSVFADLPLDEPAIADAAWPDDIWAPDAWTDAALPEPEADLPEGEAPEWPLPAEQAIPVDAIAVEEADEPVLAETAEPLAHEEPAMPEAAATLREWDVGDAWPERQEPPEAAAVDQGDEPVIQPAALLRPASGHRLRAGLAPAFQPDKPLARLSLTAQRMAKVLRWLRGMARRWF